MKKVNYNIEFGHIFVDQKFNLHQRESSQIVKGFIEKLKNNNNSPYAKSPIL